MIPFNFIYCKPDSPKEAAAVFTQMQKAGKSPLYYGGGSEIITMSRSGSIHPGAVIDIKGLPECNVLEFNEDKLVIGSANTLNKIKESHLFPLMRTACGRIADHTNQCRITLGGNLCGTIIYRETSLPLMLSDADVLLYGPNGPRIVPFNTVFHQRIQLYPGEFVVQVHVPNWALQASFGHVKKTAQEKIDYPLIDVMVLRQESRLRIAFAGLCPYPFRSKAIEDTLNNSAVSPEDRITQALNLLPAPALADAEGSSKYRRFVLKNTLESILVEWENGSI